MSVSSYGKIPWRLLLHGIHDMPAPEPTPHIHFDLLRDATSNLFDVSCQPAVRHFQRSCQTSSTPWRHPPRRPETAMRPHWWSRRRMWTRCGKFGEAFWESIQLRHHHSSFIIHHSSFIIHHSSFIIFIIHYPSISWTALRTHPLRTSHPLFFVFRFRLAKTKEAELRQQSLVAIMLSATPKIKPKPKKRVPPMHGEKREFRVSGRE